MSLTPQALRLLSKEIVTLRSDPPEGVRIVVDEEDLTSLEGWVQGPAGTPYEGGYFRVRFSFGPEYPNLPPKCTMITRIFHPNVSKSGEICVDTLKKGWDKKYGVGHVLVTIKCLLIYPNPESALDEEAGKQLLADYDGYCKYARLMTSIHATPKTLPAPFRDSASASAPTSTSSTKPPPHPVPSTAPTTRSTAPTSSTTNTKPAPLQAHAKQEQSPIISEGDGKMQDPEKPLKPVVNTNGAAAATGTGPAKTAKTAASKPKRGLKRL